MKKIVLVTAFICSVSFVFTACKSEKKKDRRGGGDRVGGCG